MSKVIQLGSGRKVDIEDLYKKGFIAKDKYEEYLFWNYPHDLTKKQHKQVLKRIETKGNKEYEANMKSLEKKTGIKITTKEEKIVWRPKTFNESKKQNTKSDARVTRSQTKKENKEKKLPKVLDTEWKARKIKYGPHQVYDKMIRPAPGEVITFDDMREMVRETKREVGKDYPNAQMSITIVYDGDSSGHVSAGYFGVDEPEKLHAPYDFNSDGATIACFYIRSTFPDN